MLRMLGADCTMTPSPRLKARVKKKPWTNLTLTPCCVLVAQSAQYPKHFADKSLLSQANFGMFTFCTDAW